MSYTLSCGYTLRSLAPFLHKAEMSEFKLYENLLVLLAQRKLHIDNGSFRKQLC